MASITPPGLRFVDFFFQAGLPPDSNLLEKRIPASDESEQDPAVISALKNTLSNVSSQRDSTTSSFQHIPQSTQHAGVNGGAGIMSHQASSRIISRGDSADIGDTVLHAVTGGHGFESDRVCSAPFLLLLTNCMYSSPSCPSISPFLEIASSSHQLNYQQRKNKHNLISDTPNTMCWSYET
jgi:hypothetical protein